MGYFSNGTEGWDYYEQYCSRCLHDKDESCPVWNAHLLHNYDECNNEGSILHMLIPREGIGNLRCTMFIERAAEGDLFGDTRTGERTRAVE
jgi:hypothetical protein